MFCSPASGSQAGARALLAGSPPLSQGDWVSFGVGEIVVIVFVLVVVFSASRMGALGNALGKFVYSFKRASKGDDVVDVKRTNARLDRQSGGSTPEDAQIVDGQSRRD